MKAVLMACALVASAGIAGAQNRILAAHPPGYIPLTVPADVQVVIPRQDGFSLRRRDRFEIYVTPNIVPERQATVRAASAAAAHCRARHGSAAATIDGTFRYTELHLGSWGFTGYCR
ncbi:hypothetical protein [Palleronia sp. LCG004]|uniref:hypothetical protein n=1 Tax=Palleronia sp. LCG004 TaxID=3079304 RepID=UPI002943AE3F|nr:hypothetical protein [Palleronia sp. LCG004]WOI54893.1 hypothetical protein RVY76_07395 [Palleronia sp. LCG004]